MNLRLELLGRVFYLEWAKAEAAQDAEPELTIADRQYPMAIPTERTGFRYTGPDEGMVEDT